MEKEWVTGIDLGVIHIGLSSVHINKKFEPKTEQSSILKPKNGLIYKTYEEGICEELVDHWLRDHWHDIIMPSKLIIVEKQMVGDDKKAFNNEDYTAKHNRACTMIEMCMRTFLKAYIAFGGPLHLAVGPCRWKALAGLDVGNNTTSPIRPKFTGSIYYPGVRNPCYKEHKEQSRIYFNRLLSQGDEEVKQVQGQYSKMPPTDVIEAYFMSRAARMNLDRLIEEAKINLNHDINLTTQGNVKRLLKEKRLIKNIPLWEKHKFDEDDNDNNKKEEKVKTKKRKVINLESDENE